MIAVEETSDDVGQLIAAAAEFYRRGWVLGTSGNFSSLVSRAPFRMCITASGHAKGELDQAQFIELDANTAILSGSGKPSAESQLHITLYQLLPQARSVMHTHSVWGTILSDKYFADCAITIEGYEMLKGLAGVATHQHKEIVPVIENSQDYAALSHVIENVVREQPNIHGIYLRRHGLYTWGQDVAEAKRHIEILEFLFEVLGRTQNWSL
jgi:methylthioribulose-1-phosphate dehydratase